MPRGKYIVIEGGDGTGKTTQADLLQQYLESQGKSVIHLKEPGGSPIAEAIRSVILDGTLPRTPMTNILLFTANRHELWHDKIKPALEAGTWVIATRNYWSTLVYQGAGEGMDQSVISAITSTFTDPLYMKPDYAMILSIDDVSVSKSRVAERGPLEKPDPFEIRGLEFHEKIRAGYLEIAKTYQLPVISASQAIDDVANEIKQIISL
jgi:dTMP kinase